MSGVTKIARTGFSSHSGRRAFACPKKPWKVLASSAINTAAGALALLTGALLVIRGRRKR